MSVWQTSIDNQQVRYKHKGLKKQSGGIWARSSPRKTPKGNKAWFEFWRIPGIVSNTSLLGWKGGKLHLARKAWRCAKARSKQVNRNWSLLFFFFFWDPQIINYLCNTVQNAQSWWMRLGNRLKNEPCFRCYDLVIGNNRKILSRDMIWSHDLIKSDLEGAKMVKRLPHLTIVEVC